MLVKAREEMIPTRRSLLSRLRNWGDDESWRTFFDTYWRLIYNAALKSGLSETEAEEVVQETVLVVCRKIQEFQYDERGSFKAWLLKITAWRITDQRRLRQPENLRESTPWTERQNCALPEFEGIDQIPDPSSTLPVVAAAWDAEWENNLLEAAMERVKNRVDPLYFQIFDLYVIQEWRATRVARALNVTAARVYVTKHRVAGLIKKELAALKKEPLEGIGKGTRR
jgi:RNA polymerase sigma factor (sigma-70 family)